MILSLLTFPTLAQPAVEPALTPDLMVALLAQRQRIQREEARRLSYGLSLTALQARGLIKGQTLTPVGEAVADVIFQALPEDRQRLWLALGAEFGAST